jgi:hypothetical protein
VLCSEVASIHPHRKGIHPDEERDEAGSDEEGEEYEVENREILLRALPCSDGLLERC